MANETFSIVDLEAAINRSIKQEHDGGIILPKDARILGDIYGQMIYDHASTGSMSTLTELQQEVFNRWTA